MKNTEIDRKASAQCNINTAYFNTVHNHANQYDRLTIWL